MRSRIGVGISSDRARAVLVRHGSVAWASEVRMDAHNVQESLATLLRAVPGRQWLRPTVTVALGPMSAQLRKVAGLPRLHDPRALERIIREDASRFFLNHPLGLLTSGVRVVEEGTVWAAAFVEPEVRTAVSVCTDAGFRVSGVIPSAAVLGYALDGKELWWEDGSVVVLVATRDSELLDVRRLPDSNSEVYERPQLHAKPPLAQLGAEAWRYADAFGAALVPRHEGLAIRPQAHWHNKPMVPRWRITLAWLLFVMSLVSAVFVPPVCAVVAGRLAEQRLATLSRARADAVALQRELSAQAIRLEKMSSFQNARSMTLLLSELTRVLPDHTALVSLRIDSADGSFVALGPSGAEVLNVLDELPVMTNPELVGSIAPEMTGHQQLERFTVKFGLTAPDGTLQ